MNELLRRILFLPPQASTVAGEIDALHYFVILTTIGGATLITVVGGIFLLRFRQRWDVAEEVRVRRSPPISPPAWMKTSVFALLLGLFVLWWSLGFAQFVRVRVPPSGTFDVYVTAKQWMWTFSYPDGGSSLSILYVPAGQPVKLILVSRDVIHSFFVPDFRLKQDVLPGRYTTLWFEAIEPGTHQILCAEYCGTSHSTMRGEVVALAPEDYARWRTGAGGARVAGPRAASPSTLEALYPEERLSLVRVGETQAAQRGCLRCHTLDGSPFIGPTWAGAYGARVPLERGGTVLVDEAYLTESMMDPRAKVHAGFAPVMPSYLGLLRPAETAAIVELIKSLRDAPPQTPAPPPTGPVEVLPP